MKKRLLTLVLITLVVSIIYLYFGVHRHPAQIGARQDRVHNLTPGNWPETPPNSAGEYHGADQKSEGNGHIQSALDNDRNATPVSAAPISFHQELDGLDAETLGAMALDPAIDDADRRTAWDAMITRIGNMENKSDALDTLLIIKDQVHGEDQQTVLKLLGTMNNEAANAAIVETISSSFFEADESNLARMLSYLSPQYPLSDAAADQLVALYDHVRSDDLAVAIINAVAAKGGDSNVQWIVTQAESAESKAQEFLILSTLSQSNSQKALVYLNKRLNELAKDAYATEDSLDQLRQTILILKKQLMEKS